MNKPKVIIIVGSTRPGRIGRAVADWFYAQTMSQADLEFELVDLADWNLPFLDEPVPPKASMYQHDHTKRWSAKIASAAGYILVTPEYNHGYPAALKNALDFLYHEWANKPVGFVSYGWGGGQMAVAQLTQVVTELRMRPLAKHTTIFIQPDMFDERHQLLDPATTLARYANNAQELVRALTVASQKEPLHEAIV
ncbi:MAG TPA: NAD(P)H-dependent oxidoreductase [Patescibacteria group bacterium]|nr:NAD(P)H-dependent oxidoreductase [Patescibacteria group bacterium]